VLEREDINATLMVRFDIRRELIRIRKALEEGDGEPPQEAADNA
jgi:hypothetical protein